MEQNYPNPFNPSTKIKFTIPSVIASETKQSQLVTLKIFDVLGREVATLVNEEKPAGSYEFEFSADRLTSGIYFYKLQAGSFVRNKEDDSFEVEIFILTLLLSPARKLTGLLVAVSI